MTKREAMHLKNWLDHFRGNQRSRQNLEEMRHGIDAGLLNAHDEYGMTALSLAAVSGWMQGVEELLQAGADTEMRHFRTGATTLLMAVQKADEPIIAGLIAAGANPDAPNHWGLTPRGWSSQMGSKRFDHVPQRETPLPPPRIQNAEHLADHHHPRFKIPERTEREMIKVGQAVDLYIYGPRAETKQDTVKVRTTMRSGSDRTYDTRGLSRRPSNARTWPQEQR